MSGRVMGQASLQAVKGGVLTGCRKESRCWILEFSGGITLECYCPWRVVKNGAESKTLLGSRDLENERDPFPKLSPFAGRV